MRQWNGSSTPAPKSSTAKQWTKEELAQKKKKTQIVIVCTYHNYFKLPRQTNRENAVLLFVSTKPKKFT